jgi:hypothetical protein
VFVDSHFRTIPDRRGRALVGLSAGGYGAVILALHHLTDFSVVESWSGYHHPTNPAGTAPLELGSAAADRKASAHTFVPQLRQAFHLRPTFFAFYVGRGDSRFRAENEQLHAELLAAGRAAPLPAVSRGPTSSASGPRMRAHGSPSPSSTSRAHADPGGIRGRAAAPLSPHPPRWAGKESNLISTSRAGSSTV